MGHPSVMVLRKVARPRQITLRHSQLRFRRERFRLSRMKSPRMVVPCCLIVFLCCISASQAATKPKVVTFGRWMPVKYYAGAEETTALELKVRPLLVNGEIKEYTIGESHEVSERVFVVRQASRLNDAL